jgi:hypothetical protein
MHRLTKALIVFYLCSSSAWVLLSTRGSFSARHSESRPEGVGTTRPNAADPSTGDAPQAVMEGVSLSPAVADLGEVAAGDVALAHVELANTTDHLIQISSVLPSCSCTVASFPNDKIEPGKRREILLKLSTRGRVGRTSTTYTVDALILPERHVIALSGTITAMIVPRDAVVPMPSNVEFGHVGNEDGTRQLEFHALPSTKATAYSIHLMKSPSWITCNQESITIPSGGNGSVTLCCSPKGLHGRIDGSLMFICSAPLSPLLEIPVAAFADKRFLVQPEIIMLSASDHSMAGQCEVSIKNLDNNDQPFEILKADLLDTKGVRARVETDSIEQFAKVHRISVYIERDSPLKAKAVRFSMHVSVRRAGEMIDVTIPGLVFSGE